LRRADLEAVLQNWEASMANHIQSELLILPCNFFCVLYKRFEHTGLVADPCRGVSYIAAMAPSRLSFILHAFNRCWDHTYGYVFFFTPDSQNTWMIPWLLLVLPKFAIKVLRCHAPLSLIYILSAIRIDIRNVSECNRIPPLGHAWPRSVLAPADVGMRSR
jgi:hypothetical protein